MKIVLYNNFIQNNLSKMNKRQILCCKLLWFFSFTPMCVCVVLLILYWSYWLQEILLPSTPKYLLLIAVTKIMAIALLVPCNKWFLINHAMITLYLPRSFFSFAKRKQFSHLTMWHLWLVRCMPPYMGVPLAIMLGGSTSHLRKSDKL